MASLVQIAGWAAHDASIVKGRGLGSQEADVKTERGYVLQRINSADLVRLVSTLARAVRSSFKLKARKDRCTGNGCRRTCHIGWQPV